jgi:DNA primase
MPDGGAAGERLAKSAFRLFAPHCFARWVRLSDGRQPTELSRDEPPDAFSPLW